MAVYGNYAVSPNEQNIAYGEVDHFIPLCAGGSNDPANLWYQPAHNEWKGANFGFREKDKLESDVCRKIKNGSMTPDDVKGPGELTSTRF